MLEFEIAKIFFKVAIISVHLLMNLGLCTKELKYTKDSIYDNEKGLYCSRDKKLLLLKYFICTVFAKIIHTVQVQNKNSELWRNFFLPNTIIRNLPN